MGQAEGRAKEKEGSVMGRSGLVCEAGGVRRGRKLVEGCFYTILSHLECVCVCVCVNTCLSVCLRGCVCVRV